MKLRVSAPAPAAYGVAPLVPVKICCAVAEAVLAVSVRLGVWTSGLKRPSAAGPRPWLPRRRQRLDAEAADADDLVRDRRRADGARAWPEVAIGGDHDRARVERIVGGGRDGAVLGLAGLEFADEHTVERQEACLEAAHGGGAVQAGAVE